MKIEVRKIPGYPGYGASPDGRIWSFWSRGQYATITDKCKELKPGTQKSGHLFVRLSKKRVKHNKSVHRLVLITFVGPCPEGMECRHFPDRNPANCRLDNLRWGTRKENKTDSFIHGTVCCGPKHPEAKLNAKYVKKARRLRAKGGITLEKLAAMFGVSIPTIYNVIIRKTWKHVS